MSGASHEPGDLAPAPAEPAVHPLRSVLRALRGHVRRTLAVALVLGAAGAAGGYASTRPEYEASGMLRVSPTTPRVLHDESDAPMLPPYFDAYASTQTSYLTSTPVLARATTEPALSRLGWPTGDAGVDALGRAVKVDRPKGTELVTVKGTGSSAEEAAAVVNAVLAAYDAVHGAASRETVSVRERALVEREQELTRALAAVDAQALETGGEFEAQSLAKAHLDKVTYLQDLERRVAELDDSIAQESTKSGDGDLRGVDEEIMRLTVLDNAMAGLLFEHAKLTANLASLRETYPEKNPTVRAAARQIEVLDKAIEDRRTQLTLLGKNGVLSKRGAAAGAETLTRLRALRESLTSTRERVRAEAVELNRKSLRLGTLETERGRLRSQLEETRRELERARTESRAELPGRVSVAVWASAPPAAARDRRRALGALGAMLGAFGALGLAVVGGLLSRRVRWSDDLDRLASHGEVLGVLPWLFPDRPASRAAFEHAARQAAQVLEVRSAGRRSGGVVVAVTGASRSGGKTTVATALATALARARLRTVLVDADLGVRGASARLSLLDAAGISDAVGGAPLEACTHATAWPGLSAVPAGHMADHPSRLARAPVAALLDDLRARHDAVIVDAGAVDLGLEGGLVSAVADETVVVVSAGQPLDAVEGALRLLDRYAGRRPVRFVLHGASHGDPGLTPSPDLAASTAPSTLALPEPA
ncbi:MAG: hypothetical protein IT460_16785 [Planctomycetes bacterium]|nr:hypothetical protein [Planctomycetota bacterium]